MLIQEALYTILTTDAGVSAIAGTRISPGFLAQATEYPAITFALLSRDSLDTETLAWEERAHSEIVESRFRFLSLSKGRGQLITASRLDEALRLALHGYVGAVSNDDSPPETVVIQGAFSESVREAYEDTTETNIVDRIFRIVHSEVRPDPISP